VKPSLLVYEHKIALKLGQLPADMTIASKESGSDRLFDSSEGSQLKNSQPIHTGAGTGELATRFEKVSKSYSHPDAKKTAEGTSLTSHIAKSPTGDVAVHRLPDTDHATVFHDSGYGSLAAKSVAPGRLDSVGEAEETALEAIAELPIAELEVQETRTVFSDAASLLNRPDVDKYISAFASELAFSLPPEFDVSKSAEFSSILEQLLKSFAIRLGHESSGQVPRQLMYLVYRFRRFVAYTPAQNAPCNLCFRLTCLLIIYIQGNHWTRAFAPQPASSKRM
jgi:hypothetical protein